VGHEVGKTLAMVCSLCELERGKEKEGDGVRLARRCASVMPMRKEKRWGSGTGARAKIESRQGCRKKRDAQSKGARRVRHHAVATRVRHMWAPPLTAPVGHATMATRHAQRGHQA
jgi:hypothetical protein